MKRFLALMLSMSMMVANTAYADDPPPTKPETVIRLKANLQFTPKVDGWFFTDSQEQQMRYRLVDADFIERELTLTKQLVENYKKINETQEQISERYKQAWEESNKTLTDVLKREGRTKFWYMTLGVILTVGAGLAIGFSAKAIK